jgi:hypothetical protein
MVGPGFAWTWAPLLLLLMFGGMLLAMIVGRRIRAGHTEATGFGAVNGAMFGLMGLMVAFTFSGAASRFDQRRHLIVEEANDIATAYRRINLLPEAAQDAFRDKFRDYLDTRLATYRVGADPVRIAELLHHTDQHQHKMWTMAIDAIARAPTPTVAAQMLPPLNAMFDIVTTRTAAAQMHPPAVVWVMLAGLTLVCSFLVGYDTASSGRRYGIHLCIYAAIFALTLYVIVDMEYPRVGFIRVTAMDHLLDDVRASMR